MSTYEYECKKCGYVFEKTMTLKEHEQAHKPRCPKCKSEKVEQRPAAFQSVTSSKA